MLSERYESTEFDRRSWLHVHVSFGDSLVRQQWRSPSSWNTKKRDFYKDAYTYTYTILNRI